MAEESWTILVKKTENEYQEFRYGDLTLFVLDGSLYIECREPVPSVRFRDLYELDTVAQGDSVEITLDSETLEEIRFIREYSETAYPVDYKDLFLHLEQEMTLEDYMKMCKEAAFRNLKRDLYDLWYIHRSYSPDINPVSVISRWLREHLRAL